MTKQIILDYFKNIDAMYNDSSMLDTLSRMLDELLKEQPQIARCKDCKHFDRYNVECKKNHNPKPPYNKWFCADGENDALRGYKDDGRNHRNHNHNSVCDILLA